MPDDTPVLPCADKLAFQTQEAARTAAVVAELQHNARLTTYRCKHCGLWHLASN